jgi:hypothetical protein
MREHHAGGYRAASFRFIRRVRARLAVRGNLCFGRATTVFGLYSHITVCKTDFRKI